MSYEDEIRDAMNGHGEDKQEAEIFLRVLDGMIESTEEFIGDDGLMADHMRIHDLSALLATRALYINVFAPDEVRKADELNQSQS